MNELNKLEYYIAPDSKGMRGTNQSSLLCPNISYVKYNSILIVTY
jgi:hypothetical protein